MKEIPILFSTDMVKAMIDLLKDQTRRTIGLNRINESDDNWKFIGLGTNPENDNDKRLYAYFNIAGTDTWTYVLSPYGQKSDILWVRETHAENFGLGKASATISYKADDWHRDIKLKSHFTFEDELVLDGWYDECLSKEVKWKPSIHMRKEYARIWLQVEEIGIERLQDISEKDAKAEGIMPLCMSATQLAETGQQYFDYSKPKQLFNEGLPPFESFNSLWCSINGGDSWESNPWVWAVKFKVLSTTGNPELSSIQ